MGRTIKYAMVCPALLCAPHILLLPNSFAMRAAWREPGQTAFVLEHLPSYIELQDKDKKTFWPDFLKEWFVRWPVPEPERRTRIEVSAFTILVLTAFIHIPLQQVKRIVRTAAATSATGGRRDLHLESGPSRRGSEVQIYMRLYYDTRIRDTIVKEWDAAGLKNMEVQVRSPQAEESIDPDVSYLLKDGRVPINFKNHVAQKLYETEEDEIKEAVRTKRKEDLSQLTVFSANEEDRLDLVREYHK